MACAIDSAQYSKTVESDRVFDFLAGLNVDLDEVRGRILGKEPLSSTREAFAEVRREESRRMVMMKKETLATVTESSALNSIVTEAAAVAFPQSNTRKFEDKLRFSCDFCHKTGHTKDRCQKLHGKPANWKGKKKGKKEEEVDMLQWLNLNQAHLPRFNLIIFTNC